MNNGHGSSRCCRTARPDEDGRWQGQDHGFAQHQSRRTLTSRRAPHHLGGVRRGKTLLACRPAGAVTPFEARLTREQFAARGCGIDWGSGPLWWLLLDVTYGAKITATL